jgi:hypothetical protein
MAQRKAMAKSGGCVIAICGVRRGYLGCFRFCPNAKHRHVHELLAGESSLTFLLCTTLRGNSPIRLSA